MNSIRFVKFYYFAAFLLGAAIALLVAGPIRADTLPLNFQEQSELRPK
jgi:hypothetical protein